MENNSIQQKNLAQSLQTDTLQQAITQYGDGYMAFLRKFPAPAKRKDYIRSVYDAVSREGMSLNSIDAYFGEGASLTTISSKAKTSMKSWKIIVSLREMSP